MSWWQGLSYKCLKQEPAYCRVCGEMLLTDVEPTRYDRRVGNPSRWRITVQCEVYGRKWFEAPRDYGRHDKWMWETGSVDEATAYAKRDEG